MPELGFYLVHAAEFTPITKNPQLLFSYLLGFLGIAITNIMN